MTLFDLFVADHEAKNRAETTIIKQKLAKYLRPRIGEIDAKLYGKEHHDKYIAYSSHEHAALSRHLREENDVCLWASGYVNAEALRDRQRT